MNADKTIAVTGAAGYLGSVLCAYLLHEGWNIRAVDFRHDAAEILSPHFGNPRFRFFKGDARDRSVVSEVLKDAEFIVPMAAIVGASKCDEDVDRAWAINFEAVELLESLRRPEQFVLFPMTNNGYQSSGIQPYLDESAPWNPDGSPYTESKYAAEQLLLNRGNAVSFRLASLFGNSPAMRWDLLIHFLIRSAVNSKKIELFDPHFKRSFVHVQDVAKCFIHAIKNPKRFENQIFNIGLESANMSKLDLAQLIQTHLPELEIKIGSAETDPDARDFFISVQKLRGAGFEASQSIQRGISEIFSSIQPKNLTLRGVA